MNLENERLYQLHAELCGTMANPKRLAILETLGEAERSVGAIAEALGISITATSQHLRVLRDKSVVTARKHGQTVYYSLSDPRMIQACHLIREILLDGIRDRGELAEVGGTLTR